MLNTLTHLRLSRPTLWAALGIFALILINSAFDISRGASPFAPGSFLHISIQNHALAGPLIDILLNASSTIILALGMTVVIAMRGVDLSVGSVMSIAGAIAAVLIVDGLSPAAAISAALATAALCGLFNGLLVAVLGIQPVIATLILMVTGRGIAQMITGGQTSTFNNATLAALGSGRFLYLPIPFLLAIALFLIALLIIRTTALGLLIEAVGSNPTAARLAGIRCKSLIAGAYIFAALGAALAGLIHAGSINAADPFHCGINAELAAIFAAVVGGTSLAGGRFTLLGAVVGGLLIQTLTATMYARDVSADVAPLAQAIVIIAVCLASRSRSTPVAHSTSTAHATRFHPTLAAAAILLAVVLFGAFRYDYFATLGTIPALLNDYAFVGIAAIGATLVILSGGIDLSPGAVIACASILIATLISGGMHPAPAFAIALAAGSGLGLAMGWLIHRFRLPAFMVTLSGMFAARATGYVIHPQSEAITHPAFAALRRASITLGPIELSVSAIVFLVLLAAAYFILTRTSFGRGIYALGGNERSARIMGIHTARTRILIYAIAGLCSALAGCAFTLYKDSGDPASAVGLELDIIASVVMGGTLLSGGVGTMWGTLIGILILATIRRIIDFEGTLSSAWTSIATGALLLIFVMLQRFASRSRES